MRATTVGGGGGLGLIERAVTSLGAATQTAEQWLCKEKGGQKDIGEKRRTGEEREYLQRGSGVKEQDRIWLRIT